MIKYFSFFFAIVIFLSSCEKETVVRYEVSLDAFFDIPGGLNTLETHYFIIRNVPTLYKQYADIKSVDTISIQNIATARGLITSRFQDIDFDLVERISVYAVSIKDPTFKREMYYVDFVPVTTGKELRMLSSTTELKKIISEEFIDLEIRVNFRTIPRTKINARIVFGYAVF